MATLKHVSLDLACGAHNPYVRGSSPLTATNSLETNPLPALANGEPSLSRQGCNHRNIICDKTAGMYRCADCGTVTGHFAEYPHVSEQAWHGWVSIGNGLYARTRGK